VREHPTRRKHHPPYPRQERRPAGIRGSGY
jgi:hypothetical protein